MKIIKSMLPISMLNIIALFFMIQRLPESIPIHFALNMAADRFAGKWILLSLGVLPIIVGSFLGAIKHNPRYRYTGLLVGFRLPWIVKDEAVWEKTHTFGEYMSITGGIITCMFSLLGFMVETPMLSITGFILGLLLCALVPAVYSYTIYKRRFVQ